MSLLATISCSLVKAITFDLVSSKILFFFHWKAQLFNLMKHQKIHVSRILVSNKVQNIRQHHFETKQGFIFDYAQLPKAE